MKIFKWVPISNSDPKKKLLCSGPTGQTMLTNSNSTPSTKSDNKENTEKPQGFEDSNTCFSDSQTTDFVSTGIPFSEEDSNSQGSEPQMTKRLKSD